MAERFSVGSLSISVVPSLEGFTEKASARLLPEADQLGSEIGDVLAAKIQEKLDNVKVRVGVDNTRADADLDFTKAKVDELNGKKAEVNVDVHNASSIRSWLVSLIAGAVAIAPAFAVGAVGVAAFGAVAVPVLAGVTKYLQDMASGSKNAGAEWEALTEDQKLMATELIALKGEFHDLSFSLQPEILQVFSAALTDIDEILPEIVTVARAAGPAIADMLSTIGAGLSDSQAQQFFNFVANNLGPDLHEISVTVVALIDTVFNLIEAMQPLSIVLLHLVAGFAELLSSISQVAPWLDDIIILAIALYKPLQAIMALKILEAFAWIPEVVAGLEAFTAAAEGASAAETAMVAAELALEAAPWFWIGTAVAGLIALGVVIAHETSDVYGLRDALVVQYKATGLNVQGYRDLSEALDSSRKVSDLVAGSLRNQSVQAGGLYGSLALVRGRTTSLTDEQRTASTQADNVSDSLLLLQERYGLTATQAIQLALTQRGVIAAFKEGGPAAQAMRNQIAAYVREQDIAHDHSDLFKQDLDGIANSAAGATTQIKALTDAFNGMINPNLTAEQDVVNMKNDIVALSKAMSISKGVIGDHTQAQRDSFSAYNKTIQDIENTENATLSATGAQRKHDLQILQNSIPYLESLAKHNSTLRGGIQALIKTIEAIPAHESSSISVSGHGTWAVVAGGHRVVENGPPNETGAARGMFVAHGQPGVDDQHILAQRGEVVVPVPMVDAGAVDHLRGHIPGFNRFASGGVVGNYDGSVPGLAKFTANQYNASVKAVQQATAQSVQDALAAALAGSSSGAGGSPGGGTKQFTGTVLSALAQLGLPAAFLNDVLYQMTTESGGRVNAVNLTDINAQEGHPSVGLMQVIAGTFAEWAGPYRNTGPFLYGVSIDPMANIYAALNYGKHGRGFGGGPGQIGSGHGYDDGGWLPPGITTVYNNTGSPEPVLSDKQWAMLSGVVAGGDGGGTHYHANFTMPDMVFESRVRTAFKAMDMAAAARERTGRPS